MPPTKQYVNLPAKEGEKSFGNKPTLEAIPKKKGMLEFGKRKVMWEVAPGDKNVDKKYLARDNRAKLKEEESTEADGKFANVLTLPFVGKETYKVKCKKKAKKPSDQTALKELEFETWRKIYYTIWVMNDDCEAIFTKVKDRFHAAFEPAGVELEQVGGILRCKTDEDWTLMTSDPAEYDLPWVYPNGTAEIEHKPFHLKLVVLHDLRELAEAKICNEVDKTKDEAGSPTFWVVDLDKTNRPAPKGTVKVEAINAPSKLTQEQVDALKAPKVGDTLTVSTAGKLTKGALDVTATKVVVYDGAAWKLLTSDAKTLEQTNALTPAKGVNLKVSDGGKLTKGDLTVAANDQVVYDGAKWVKTGASLGTFRVVDVNDPKLKPAGPTDEQLDSLMAPADGDCWEVEDKGTLTAGTVKVLEKNLVKWAADKWVIYRGKWEYHMKPGSPLAKDDTWKKDEILYVIEGVAGASNLDVAHMSKISDDELKIELHKDAKVNDAIDRGLKVKIQPKLAIMESNCCGYSIGNFAVVRTNENPDRLESCILQTFTHEIGHGLQQAVKEFPLYKADGTATGTKEKNTLWHTDDKGGQGPHCWFNAKEIDSGGKTTSGKTFEWDSTKGKMCTLFFRDDANVDEAGKFCSTCAEGLRKTNLSASAMNAKGWNRFK